MSSKRAASKPILGIFPLLEKQWLNAFYYRLRLSAREIAEQCHPGQFVNVRLAGRREPLLPRPLSIFRRSREEGWIELLVKSVGRGTRLFAQAHPGNAELVVQHKDEFVGCLHLAILYRRQNALQILNGAARIAGAHLFAGNAHAQIYPLYRAHRLVEQ